MLPEQVKQCRSPKLRGFFYEECPETCFGHLLTIADQSFGLVANPQVADIDFGPQSSLLRTTPSPMSDQPIFSAPAKACASKPVC